MTDEEHRERHRQQLATEWTVSTTPMTQRQADEAALLITKTFHGVYADPVDPRSFLTVGFDRWSAESVRAGLSMVVDAGGDVGSLLEMFEDFLAYGYPYQDGEDSWPSIP